MKRSRRIASCELWGFLPLCAVFPNFDGEECVHERECGEERVHASILRVPDDERMEGNEDGGEPCSALGEKYLREAIGERDEQHTRGECDEARAEFGQTRQPQPIMVEDVIEWRIDLIEAVLVDDFADGLQREQYVERFVAAQRLSIYAPET